MSEMIERVAKAMADGDWEFIPEGESTYLEDGLFRGDYRDLARAAIEAMREPTEAMSETGCNFVAYGDHGSSDIWRAMIDKALR